MYQSIDYGISWSLIDSMVVLPTDYDQTIDTASPKLVQVIGTSAGFSSENVHEILFIHNN